MEFGKQQNLINTQTLINRTPVLVFHKISSQREFGINSCPPQKFNVLIEYLADQKFQPITFLDLLSDSLNVSKPIIMTFDDGYESVYKHALPIMRQFGFSAVVFMVAGFIDRWNDWDVNLGGVRFRHLSKSQIKELYDEGWEIGSHTNNHIALSFLKNNQLENELCKSKAVLEEIINDKVISIAYPFGLQNKSVLKAVIKAGYVFGCKNFSWNSNTFDLLNIPRISIDRTDNLQSFKNKTGSKNMPGYLRVKLAITNCLASFSPVYQRFFRQNLFLEK
jgi:peptidoglycan/xylan/chitin deacetylase (PgdA/CDA1 family)